MLQFLPLTTRTSGTCAVELGHVPAALSRQNASRLMLHFVLVPPPAVQSVPLPSRSPIASMYLALAQCVVLISGNRYRRENPNNRNHNHELDQREATRAPDVPRSVLPNHFGSLIHLPRTS